MIRLIIVFCVAVVLQAQRSHGAQPDGELVVEVASKETTAVVSYLSWDTEGTGRERQNLLKISGLTLEFGDSVNDAAELKPICVDRQTTGSERWSRVFAFTEHPALTWEVRKNDQELSFHLSNASSSTVDVERIVVNVPFDPTVTPTAFIPAAWDDERDVMQLPGIVSAPDFGQVVLRSSDNRVTANMPGSRSGKWTNLRLTVPVPEGGSSVSLTMTPLRLDYPAGVDRELWELARRGWFNAFQPSADWRHDDRQISAPLGMLGNNVISDPASFCLWMFADQAMWQPELASGISMVPSIRRTIEWWMDEKTNSSGKTIGYWDYFNFMDSNPSLIIAAWDYVEMTSDTEWLKGRIEKLEFLSSYIESRNIDDDGLVEAEQSGNRNTLIEPLRSSCWWDAINCGHKDGYSNAIVYRAWRCLADLEKTLGRMEQAAKFTRLADDLKASYVKVLLNPETGWLGWWRSADGELHDYATPVVNALAIEYGLVEPEQGRRILALLREKMDTAGFTNHHLGVPCFLEPVHRSDYLQPHGLGCPRQEDGRDTFGQYMNGGISASPMVHFLAAHYVAGDPEPADAMLRKMLEHLNAGKFQHGVTDEIMTGIDWTNWDGKPTGYEGYLSDSFRFVQGVYLKNPENRAKLYRPLLP